MIVKKTFIGKYKNFSNDYIVFVILLITRYLTKMLIPMLITPTFSDIKTENC